MFNICKETNIAEMEKPLQDSDEDFQQEVFEEQGAFAQDIMINQSLLERVSKTSLNLNTDDVFQKLSTIDKLKNKVFNRKNHVITCISTREYSLDIKHTVGTTEIPLVIREEIEQKLMKVSPEIRKTISYIHIGSIKIMLKSTFRTGINSPVKLALVDRRMLNTKDAIFGGIQGNLAYGKLIFTCNPQIGVPLDTKKINSTVCLAHKFEREDLMGEGDKPFSVTYKIGYSLTNSHHSMLFKSGEKISIDGIFKEIGKVSQVPFQEVAPLDSQWAMDLTKKPLIGSQPQMRLETGSTSRRNRTEDEDENLPSLEIDSWYDPRKQALLRAHNRRMGLPPPTDIHTVSRRIKNLSLELN